MSTGLTRYLPFCCLLAVLALILACSSDKATNGNNPWGDIQLSTYTAVIEQIAPPLFDGGSALAKPAAIDPIWATGDYPLLGKVFGEDEPMSLYRNISSLDDQINRINEALAAQHDTITEQQGDQTYHGVFDIEELSGAVSIPEQARAILGSDPLEFDYHLSFSIEELPAMVLEAAFSVDSVAEEVLCYQSMPTGQIDPQYPNGNETNLFWAHRDLESGAIQIKCVFFKDYGDQTSAIWGYEIHTVGISDFQYRMSWYSNEAAVPDGFLGAIIGGGNKDWQFVLRYRDYNPPDSLQNDISQLFGEGYTDAGNITAEFEDYIDDTLFITYDDLPTGLLENPLDTSELSPWGRH